MKKFMPYLLPLVTILVVAGFLLFDPGITGFAIQDQDYDATIKISTHEFIVVPEDTVVEVSLDDISSTMTFKEFIEKTNVEYELVEGSFKDIDYSGYGYSGRHEYFLPISEFGFDSIEEAETLRVKVRYRNYLISESVVPIKE